MDGESGDDGTGEHEWNEKENDQVRMRSTE